MLGLRVLTGIVGVPVLVGLVFLGGFWYLAGVLVPVVIGMLELFGMLRAAGHRPIAPLGIAMALAFVLDAAYPEQRILPIALTVGVVAALIWTMLRADWSGGLVDWALTLAPALYIGGLLKFFVPLRATPSGVSWFFVPLDPSEGVFWVLMVLICTWFSDSAAYFAGRAWGRAKLAPRVSPAKSVEGAAAGIVAPLLIAVVAALIAGQAPLRLAGLGATVGVCAVVGDLLESFLKRQCGVKDSGAIVPGHGGILDRMDSLLLAVAGAYFYVVTT